MPGASLRFLKIDWQNQLCARYVEIDTICLVQWRLGERHA